MPYQATARRDLNILSTFLNGGLGSIIHDQDSFRVFHIKTWNRAKKGSINCHFVLPLKLKIEQKLAKELPNTCNWAPEKVIKRSQATLTPFTHACPTARKAYRHKHKPTYLSSAVFTSNVLDVERVTGENNTSQVGSFLLCFCLPSPLYSREHMDPYAYALVKASLITTTASTEDDLMTSNARTLNMWTSRLNIQWRGTSRRKETNVQSKWLQSDKTCNEFLDTSFIVTEFDFLSPTQADRYNANKWRHLQFRNAWREEKKSSLNKRE